MMNTDCTPQSISSFCSSWSKICQMLHMLTRRCVIPRTRDILYSIGRSKSFSQEHWCLFSFCPQNCQNFLHHLAWFSAGPEMRWLRATYSFCTFWQWILRDNFCCERWGYCKTLQREVLLSVSGKRQVVRNSCNWGLKFNSFRCTELTKFLLIENLNSFRSPCFPQKVSPDVETSIFRKWFDIMDAKLTLGIQY